MKRIKRRIRKNIKLITAICLLFQIIEVRAQQADNQIYVSTTGDDANQGTIQNPKKNLAAALDFAKNNRYNSTIILREGYYEIKKTIRLENFKQPNNQILTIKGYKNENVILSGGKKLRTENFKKITAKDGNYYTLPEEARDHVYVFNLGSDLINQIGSISDRGFGHTQKPVQMELFFNDEPLQLSRWPNDRKLKIAEVINPEKVEFTANKNKDRVIKYSKKKRAWKNKKDIWISGYLNQGWADEYISIDSLNETQQTVYLSSIPTYGIIASDGGPGKWDNDIDKKAIRGFYFSNVLDELDQPGEYYISKAEGKIYLWPTSDISTASIEVSIIEQPLMVLNKTTSVSLSNIVFKCSKSALLQLNNTNNVKLENCKFSNSGLYAIKLANTSKTLVKNCDFKNIGAAGLIFEGGDRKNLVPSMNNVTYCTFENLSRLFRSYNPAIRLDGVGVSINNCIIKDLPGQAITYQGNNHLIENNYFKNLCKEFSDIGALYTGRDLSSTGTIILNNVFEDITSDNPYRIAAVYMDDGAGGITIKNNLFVNCGTKSSNGFGAVHINGGSNNSILNNIFIDCSKIITGGPWSSSHWNSYLKQEETVAKIKTKVDITSEVYKKSYPYLEEITNSNLSSPRKNYFQSNITYQTDTTNNNRSNLFTNLVLLNQKPTLVYKNGMIKTITLNVRAIADKSKNSYINLNNLKQLN
ncbi:hypothetical protein BWI93_08630 [Siphonobacter sp. BAB-5385]|uniref:right-handed parallel beta-helix repeat-containing protein n=1 Tax=Siphonobacter sp. BAB-5385 TaxID=1864822 RepID=UPI000B9E0E65|nr:right-handed parallel beta-helix repeat-containing protein [Siphonobacter sp. BAB-5385]OZI08563.1 hypothetical protein BWI93_08630 [Siphonobacter sp. BAB-5385]